MRFQVMKSDDQRRRTRRGGSACEEYSVKIHELSNAERQHISLSLHKL